MAKQLHDLKVKMGHLIPVVNQGRLWNEARVYWSLKIEDLNGRGERYVLFTQPEFERRAIVDAVHLSRYSVANNKVGKMTCSDLKAGRLYPAIEYFKNGKSRATTLLSTRQYSVVKKEWYIVIIRATPSALKRAEARGQRNPEDNAVTGFWQDLLD